jgi:hypothetical protein
MRRVDTVARAKNAAGVRWSNPAEKLEAAKTALAQAPQPRSERTVRSLAEAPREAVSVERRAGIAQQVEQPIRNPQVAASILGRVAGIELAAYRCPMHRQDNKTCPYCALEHGRSA